MRKGEIAQILTKSNCGLLSSPESKDELVNNVMKIKSMKDDEIEVMSKNSIKFYNENFKKSMVFEKILNLL